MATLNWAHIIRSSRRMISTIFSIAESLYTFGKNWFFARLLLVFIHPSRKIVFLPVFCWFSKYEHIEVPNYFILLSNFWSTAYFHQVSEKKPVFKNWQKISNSQKIIKRLAKNQFFPNVYKLSAIKETCFLHSIFPNKSETMADIAFSTRS